MKAENVLLTGVSRGVGLAVTAELLAAGYRVFGVSRSVTDDLVRLLERYPDQLRVSQVDLSSPSIAEEKVFRELVPRGLEIHSFISNAAIATEGLVTDCDESSVQKMFAVNLFSPMLLTKSVLRRMLAHQTRGAIVHISSIAAHTGFTGLSHYSATKAALEAFSRCTAREWGSRGIRSNCLVAGFLPTEMSSSISNERQQAIIRRASTKAITSVESVVSGVRFLISDKSSSLTGQNIIIDGGTL